MDSTSPPTIGLDYLLALDEGVLYEFDTAYQLVSDFYREVDRVLKEVCP